MHVLRMFPLRALAAGGVSVSIGAAAARRKTSADGAQKGSVVIDCIVFDDCPILHRLHMWSRVLDALKLRMGFACTVLRDLIYRRRDAQAAASCTSYRRNLWRCGGDLPNLHSVPSGDG